MVSLASRRLIGLSLCLPNAWSFSRSPSCSHSRPPGAASSSPALSAARRPGSDKRTGRPAGGQLQSGRWLRGRRLGRWEAGLSPKRPPLYLLPLSHPRPTGMLRGVRAATPTAPPPPNPRPGRRRRCAPELDVGRRGRAAFAPALLPRLVWGLGTRPRGLCDVESSPALKYSLPTSPFPRRALPFCVKDPTLGDLYPPVRGTLSPFLSLPNNSEQGL